MNVRDLAKARVVVIGDAMKDIWHYGHWSKITGEGIPAFLIERTEELPGGAANVKAGIEALGARANLLAKPLPKWPRKVRFSAHGTVFRADREDCTPISEDAVRVIMGILEREAKPGAIVLSDYAKGTLTTSLCHRVLKWAKEHDVKTIADPKGRDWLKYHGCDVITPNMREWHEKDGWHSGDVIVTDGEHGCSVLPLRAPIIQIPGHSVAVRDVCGAGDTFTASLACALAVGFDLLPAAKIANAAASVAVSKDGTAVVTMEELEAALAHVDL